MQRGDYVEFKQTDVHKRITRFHVNCLYKVEVVTVDNRVKLEGHAELVDARYLQVVSLRP